MASRKQRWHARRLGCEMIVQNYYTNCLWWLILYNWWLAIHKRAMDCDPFNHVLLLGILTAMTPQAEFDVPIWCFHFSFTCSGRPGAIHLPRQPSWDPVDKLSATQATYLYDVSSSWYEKLKRCLEWVPIWIQRALRPPFPKILLRLTMGANFIVNTTEACVSKM